MRLQVAQRGFFRAIRIAVFAKVGAGVVFTDVLAGDATTELALTFVLVVLFLNDCALSAE